MCMCMRVCVCVCIYIYMCVCVKSEVNDISDYLILMINDSVKVLISLVYWQ